MFTCTKEKTQQTKESAYYLHNENSDSYTSPFTFKSSSLQNSFPIFPIQVTHPTKIPELLCCNVFDSKVDLNINFDNLFCLLNLANSLPHSTHMVSIIHLPKVINYSKLNKHHSNVPH